MKIYLSVFLLCLIAIDHSCAAFSFGGFGFGDKKLNESELIRTEYDELIQCLLENNKRTCIVASDQAGSGIYVYDLANQRNAIWSFQFMKSKQIPEEDRPLFKAISDAKLAYRDYFLFSTSGGIIGVIEIETKRLLKYWHIKGNLHSMDIAPDGTIVAVASEQNFMVVLPSISNYVTERKFNKNLKLVVDCKPNIQQLIKKYWFPYGHAVVWDYRVNQHFWIGGNRTIKSFKYNFDNEKPEIKLYQDFVILDDQVHDMTPLPESNLLWITTLNFVYLFNTENGNVYRLYAVDNVKAISTDQKRLKNLGKVLKIIEKYIDKTNVQNIYEQGGIIRWKESKFKDLSELLEEIRLNGKLKNATILDDEILSLAQSAIQSTIYVTPTNSTTGWSTDQVLNLETRKPIFSKHGCQFYKARYLQYNSFSYDLYFPKLLV